MDHYCLVHDLFLFLLHVHRTETMIILVYIDVYSHTCLRGRHSYTYVRIHSMNDTQQNIPDDFSVLRCKFLHIVFLWALGLSSRHLSRT